MSRYSSEEQAQIDGFSIRHQPERHRFALLRDDRVIGEAHYTPIGETAASEADIIDVENPKAGRAAIDFDHTFVTPEFRGTGLSELLAERALTDEIVKGRRVLASCWFIAQHLRRRPHLLDTE